MDSPEVEQPSSELLARLRPYLQWALIFITSVLCVGGLNLAALPAAALIGPMVTGVLVGVNGATVRVPKSLFAAAQAVIGILIASSIEPEIMVALADEWLLFLVGVVSTVGASSYLGWLISRWKILPGSTAVWGSAPGAATAMVLMADAFGADFRLVAFMQYLRVIVVAIVAASIAGLFSGVGNTGTEADAVIWFPPLDSSTFAVTLAIAATGALAGRVLRLPSPFFLGAMVLGISLHLGAGVEFQLPPWLLVVAYALIGWSIGLNFTRGIILHATRALPQIIGSILVLILFCGCMAFLLSRLLGIDLLTAYLATSPGGMDSVAIIAAASSNVNMSFIMAMQMARFLFVLLLGPTIARMIAKAVKD